jgi:hypothetical protein
MVFDKVDKDHVNKRKDKKDSSNLNLNVKKEKFKINESLSITKKRIIIYLIISIFVATFLIIFSEGDVKKFFGDITNIVTTIPGVIVGIILLIKCRKKKSLSNFAIRALLSLTIGLFLWLFANFLWAYYEFGIGINTPFPSFADAMWISGYFFFMYYFFLMNKQFTRQGGGNILIYMSLTTGIALAYIYILTFGVAEIVSAQRHPLTTILSILYPILDGILLIPSISILWNVKKNDSSSLLWILISISMILFIVGDTYYGYGTILGITDLNDTSIYYNAGYLAIAFGLYWYYKVSINDKPFSNEQNLFWT